MQPTTASGFLTWEEIVKFQDITQKVKGISLTPEQAEEQGRRLVQLFEAIGISDSETRIVKNGTVLT